MPPRMMMMLVGAIACGEAFHRAAADERHITLADRYTGLARGYAHTTLSSQMTFTVAELGENRW